MKTVQQFLIMVELGRIHPLLMNTMVLAYLVCASTRIFSLSPSFFVSVPELAIISFIEIKKRITTVFFKVNLYVNNNMGYMFRLTSSHLQALKMKIQTDKCLLCCGTPYAYRVKSMHYT